MGLEVVAKEIIEQGEQEAAAIETEGLKEAKAILEEAREKAQRLLAERQAAGAREAERVSVQDTARAEFEAKKRILVAKRDLWERLRSETLAALEKMPDADRRRILLRLVDRAAQDIPDGVVHVRKEDVGLIEGETRHRLEGDLAGVGGAVVESQDGSVSIDLRFETILEDLWPEVLKAESKRLFG